MTKLITTVIILLFTLLSYTQTASNTVSSSKTSSSISININTEDDDGYSTSISIKNSENILRLKARFNKNKTNKIKQILLDRLGKTNLKINNSTYKWTNNNYGDDFECKLSKGNLFIIVDKQVVANHFFKEINTLIHDLRYVISGNDQKNEEKRNAVSAKHNIEKAQRDLERAKRNLEQAKRNLERVKNN